jgi:DNA-binding transcriptional regulator GbsR (MarR family)
MLEPATFQVLRALFVSPQPVSLRELMHRSDLQLRSVQLVVEKLLESELIYAEDAGYRKFFALNTSHFEYQPLRAYFDKRQMQELGAEADSIKDASRTFAATSSLFILARRMREAA